MPAPRPLVFEDHPAIAVHLAFVGALAAHESEFDGARIVLRGRSYGLPDASPVSLGVGEAIPVDVRRLQAADEDARRPVGFRRYPCWCVGDDAAEGRGLCHLEG